MGLNGDIKMIDLSSIKKGVLVFDVETSAFWPDGKEINIQTNFEEYVQYAKVKWFGAFSYKTNTGYIYEPRKDFKKIVELLNQHIFLVGFNNEEFDFPILCNNGLIENSKQFTQVDIMKILGASNFKDKNGYKFKGRGALMGFKMKGNSLSSMAEAGGVENQKSSIDYTIFAKDSWTEEERIEIIKYLKNDVMATKQLFDKLWDYWQPFTELIDWKFVLDLSWIRSSIASLIYKSACFLMNVEPTYAEGAITKEEMGGNVYEPKYEEVKNVWSLDFTSLYPHVFCMFNLFSEVDKSATCKIFNGNNLFKVKGCYNTSYEHILSKAVQEKLKERNKLKKENPDSPMVYTLKIWLNGLYGIIRSPIFEKVHTNNAGWDVCWVSQQIQAYVENRLQSFGFENVGGDTDSLFEKALKEEHNNKEYLQKCLKTIIDEINQNVPFKIDTFEIKIEKYWNYALFPFADEELIEEDIRQEINDLLKKNIELPEPYKLNIEDKKKVIRDTSTNTIIKIGVSWVKSRRGKKKNYAYVYEEDGIKKLEIVGLPIKKDNATPLGMKIFKEVLEPLILHNERAKFPKEFIDEQINNYLKNKDILTLFAREFKVKPVNTYAENTGIHAQISLGYFNGQGGVINLIKNNKVGNAGKGDKYCTIEEALEAKLTIEELDLEKIYNELEPFIIYVKPEPKPVVEKLKKPKKVKVCK